MIFNKTKQSSNDKVSIFSKIGSMFQAKNSYILYIIGGLVLLSHAVLFLPLIWAGSFSENGLEYVDSQKTFLSKKSLWYPEYMVFSVDRYGTASVNKVQLERSYIFNWKRSDIATFSVELSDYIQDDERSIVAESNLTRLQETAKDGKFDSLQPLGTVGDDGIDDGQIYFADTGAMPGDIVDSVENSDGLKRGEIIVDIAPFSNKLFFDGKQTGIKNVFGTTSHLNSLYYTKYSIDHNYDNGKFVCDDTLYQYDGTESIVFQLDGLDCASFKIFENNLVFVSDNVLGWYDIDLSQLTVVDNTTTQNYSDFEVISVDLQGSWIQYKDGSKIDFIYLNFAKKILENK